MNFRSLSLLLTLLFALPVHADAEAPDALVNRVSAEVLQTCRVRPRPAVPRSSLR